MFGKWITVLLVLCGFWGNYGASSALAQSYLAEDLLAGLGSGPTVGVADAPVTIVEFSDFQCGYCKKFWAETLPKLRESYIDPVKRDLFTETSPSSANLPNRQPTPLRAPRTRENFGRTMTSSSTTSGAALSLKEILRNWPTK